MRAKAKKPASKQELQHDIIYWDEYEAQYDTHLYVIIAVAATLMAFFCAFKSKGIVGWGLAGMTAAIVNFVCIEKAARKEAALKKMRREKEDMKYSCLETDGQVVDVREMPQRREYHGRKAFAALIEYHNEFDGTEEVWEEGLAVCPKKGSVCRIRYTEDGRLRISEIKQKAVGFA